MRTRLTIMGIVLAAVATALGTIILLRAMIGWRGLAIGLLGAVAVLVGYRLLLQPWQHRWGATDQEVRRAMPGDDLIPGAASTTRAIAIAAPPERVWPWLVQLAPDRLPCRSRVDRRVARSNPARGARRSSTVSENTADYSGGGSTTSPAPSPWTTRW